jgi:hypothetical protein
LLLWSDLDPAGPLSFRVAASLDFLLPVSSFGFQHLAPFPAVLLGFLFLNKRWRLVLRQTSKCARERMQT